MKSEGGVVGFVSKALSTLVRPSEGMTSGNDADSVFARARVFLERDNLGAALRELNQLNPEIRSNHLDVFMPLALDRLCVNNAVTCLRAHARVAARFDKVVVGRQ
jgi:hypothetical protein